MTIFCFWHLLEEKLSSTSKYLFLYAWIFDFVYMWFIKVFFIVFIGLFGCDGQFYLGHSGPNSEFLNLLLCDNAFNISLTFRVTYMVFLFLFFHFLLFIFLLLMCFTAIVGTAFLNWVLHIVLFHIGVAFEEFIFFIDFYLQRINYSVKSIWLKRTLFALLLLAFAFIFFLVRF